MTRKTRKTIESRLWKDYYLAQGASGKPSTMLLDALLVSGKKPLTAIDIGCGRGFDTLYLLKKGTAVTAVDNQPFALKLLKESAPARLKKRLRTVCKAFHQLTRYDFEDKELILGAMSLFFCPPYRQRAAWKRLVRYAAPGTVIAINFLGKRDSWAVRRSMSSQSRAELNKMLAGFSVVSLEEKNFSGKTLAGFTKRWHYFTVIARKK